MERWFAEGRANGETVGPLMYFDLHVPRDDLKLALRVQASRLAGPEFTRERLEREAPRTLQEVENLDRSDEGYTSKFAAMAFVQAAFHGQAKVALKEKTRGYTPDNIRDFWTRPPGPTRRSSASPGPSTPRSHGRRSRRLSGRSRRRTPRRRGRLR